ITSSAGANGAISPTPSVNVDYGNSQHFSISPVTGYHVDSLIVDGSSITPDTQYTFTNVTANHTIHAAFAINVFTITSSAGSNGTISPTPSVNVNYGDSTTFTFTPALGYHVDSVYVDNVSQTGKALLPSKGNIRRASLYTGTSYTFQNVTSNHTIYVTFAIDVFTITSSAGAHGSISPTPSVNVDYGNSQHFSISPVTGYHVDSLIVDGSPITSDTQYTFTNVTANHTIHAAFAINVFTITSSAGSNGAISPTPTVNVDYSNSQHFSISPVTGYHVDSLIVDGSSITPDTQYTFTNVTANHTIHATFAINVFTITSSAGSNGTISPIPSVNVNYGDSTTFTLTPATGYHVDSVYVDNVSQTGKALLPSKGNIRRASLYTGTSYTFQNVKSNHTISVTFAIDVFTITSSAGPNGTISPIPSVNVGYGNSQHFSIIPVTGYHVDSLIVDGTSITPDTQYTFTNVTANHTIHATFAINVFTITSSAGSNGTISPIPSVNVNYGDSTTFTFTPATGYHVDSVYVDNVSQTGKAFRPSKGNIRHASLYTGTSYTFQNVTANHTIYVTFAIDNYTITATAEANGSIAPSGAVSVNNGSSQSFSISSNTGYHIDSVLVDGTSEGAITNYPFTNVTENHTIHAYFSINVYTITSSAGAHGTISPTPSVNVDYGNSQHYSISPVTGYHVDSLLVDGSPITPDTQYTFTNVTVNHTIHAAFATNVYTITSSTGAHGSISPTSSVNVDYGNSQHFSISPNTGYHVDSLVIDGSPITPDTQYTFTNVTANHTIHASFAINVFSITSSAGAHGTISPVPSVNVDYGNSQHYSISPVTGYHVDSLLVDGSPITPDTQYTFTNVTANHTIHAAFAIDVFTIMSSAGLHGSISPTPSVSVNYGSSPHFSISPNTGYHVDSLIIDGSSVPPDTQYTFTVVTTIHSIRAVFAINVYTITSSAGSHGTISPMPSVNVNYGGSQHFSVSANTGYHVDSLFIDGLPIAPDTQHTFTNVTVNHAIRVVFAVNVYTITSSAGANGTILPTPSVNVNYGNNQHFSISVNTGYHVDSLFIDGSSVTPDTQHTFTNVTMDHSIRVVFAIDVFTITASAGANGSILPLGTVLVNYNANQTFTISANPGYMVDSLLIDGIPQAGSLSYVFNSVTSNHTIAATFILKPSYANTYRTFTYDSLIVKTAVKKKAIAQYWEFNIKNTTPADITQLNITFQNDVSAIVGCGAFTPVPSPSSKKVWVFNGFLAAGDSITLAGQSPKAGNQKIAKLWLGPITKIPKSVILLATKNIGLLPMPNVANVRDDVFGRGLSKDKKTGGLIVGKMRPDSTRVYGWVRMKSSGDMFKSLMDKSITPIHNAINTGFQLFNSGAKFVKEQATLPPGKQNDKTFADLLTLKFNITMSMMGTTPHGFGELRYVDPGNPFDTMLVRDIATYGDSMMTYANIFSGQVQLYGKLDTVLMRINSAFSAPFDTVSWSDTLKLKATIRVVDIGFLAPTNIAPAIIQPTMGDGETVDLPKSIQLYQNYPNPFNPTTNIQFDLPQSMLVTLKVYNILGQEVATLVNHEMMTDGNQEVQFNGSNFASGVYFYRIVAEPVVDENGNIQGQVFISTKKMVLVK
ncbi:MAG: T9SS type A sorting domain-containing protein, partial [Bacteroidota bacterium]